jgi:hypothetical protein
MGMFPVGSTPTETRRMAKSRNLPTMRCSGVIDVKVLLDLAVPHDRLA